MEKIIEPYIETVSGIKFPFLNPKEEHISIEDIAFSLSNSCRFNGHVPFMSVAEHSVLVANRLSPDQQLAGLLHDAAEAYLSDVPSPIKAYLPDYIQLEKTVQDAINRKYGINSHTMEVLVADKDATYTEAFFLLDSKGEGWLPAYFKAQYKYKPLCLSPEKAYSLFMDTFLQLHKNNKTLWTLTH